MFSPTHDLFNVASVDNKHSSVQLLTPPLVSKRR